MAEKLQKMGNKWSYSFGNNTTVHLYSKPSPKIKTKLKKTFASYTPSKSKQSMSKTFGEFKSLHNIVQGDKKSPKCFRTPRLYTGVGVGEWCVHREPTRQAKRDVMDR